MALVQFVHHVIDPGFSSLIQGWFLLLVVVRGRGVGHIVIQMVGMVIAIGIGGAGMAQWLEHSPPTNVTWVRFLAPESYVG